MPTLVSRPEQVTPAWLTDVLREAGALGRDSRVVSFDATPIGTGQVGANVRFVLTYDGEPGPPTVVCKFASADPDSAAAGVSTLTYETEVAFYRELAHTVHVSRPHCYFADLEHGTANVVIVLEDLAPAEQGDQIAGCAVEQAEIVMDEAAKLHAPRWGDPSLADMAWLNRPPSGGTVLLALLGRLPRALPRHARSGDDRGRPAARGRRRRAARPAAPRADRDPRRLPPRQHALRCLECDATCHGRRLADRARRVGAAGRRGTSSATRSRTSTRAVSIRSGWSAGITTGWSSAG